MLITLSTISFQRLQNQPQYYLVFYDQLVLFSGDVFFGVNISYSLFYAEPISWSILLEWLMITGGECHQAVEEGVSKRRSFTLLLEP